MAPIAPIPVKTAYAVPTGSPSMARASRYTAPITSTAHTSVGSGRVRKSRR